MNTGEEYRRLLKEADQAGICLRLLGGLAIKLHCGHTGDNLLQRQNLDIDVATDREGGRRMGKFMLAQGYAPDLRFNTLNGDRRQLYSHPDYEFKVDVFVGEFEMCHRLPLSERLAADPLTVPLAELFLSKGQIVALNEKDASDILLLLLNHELGNGDMEIINQQVIMDLCGRDWGWYTTVSDNLEIVRTYLGINPMGLDQEQVRVVTQRLDKLHTLLATTPKTIQWRLRAKVGRRMRWYLEVEEVQR